METQDCKQPSHTDEIHRNQQEGEYLRGRSHAAAIYGLTKRTIGPSTGRPSSQSPDLSGIEVHPCISLRIRLDFCAERSLRRRSGSSFRHPNPRNRRRGESWLALVSAATLPVGQGATGKRLWRQFRMTVRDRGPSPAPESLPTPSMSHRRRVANHPRSFMVDAVALAMRRSLAPSAAPIPLGATSITSALATQRLSSALDAAALRRTGAITSPPLMAAAKPSLPGRRFANGGPILICRRSPHASAFRSRSAHPRSPLPSSGADAEPARRDQSEDAGEDASLPLCPTRRERARRP